MAHIRTTNVHFIPCRTIGNDEIGRDEDFIRSISSASATTCDKEVISRISATCSGNDARNSQARNRCSSTSKTYNLVCACIVKTSKHNGPSRNCHLLPDVGVPKIGVFIDGIVEKLSDKIALCWTAFTELANSPICNLCAINGIIGNH